MTTAVVGIGGNVGPVRQTLAAAVAGLADIPGVRVEAVSALFETPPWGKTDQPAFLNAAVRIETSLAARELLDAALAVERGFGRERGERWGPRTLDLDILVFGSQAVDEPGLAVPHPRLTERAFALVPLAEVWPEAPVGGRSAAEWLESCDRSGIVMAAGPGWHLGTS